MKRLIKSEPLGPGRKVQSPLWWNWRNDPLVAADRCEIKERGKEIKEGSVVSREGRGSFIWIRAGLVDGKKKCNRMVTVRTQTRRREGIKLGLTFETRWNVIRHRDKTPFSFADWIKSFFLSTWILFLSLLNLILHSLFCITRSTRDRWNSYIFSSNFQWSSNIGAIRSVYFLIFLDRTCFFLAWQFI